MQKSPFDEHLRGTTSANFTLTCLPYFSVQIHAKFVVLSNVFLTSLMFSSERAVLHLPEFSMFPEFSLFLLKREMYFITFCWIVFLHGVARLNPYLSAAWTISLFLLKWFSTTKVRSSFDIWSIVILNLPQKLYFRIFLWAFCFPSYLIMTPETRRSFTNSRITSLTKQLFWVISNYYHFMKI